MKATTVFAVILSFLSAVAFSGCSRGPAENPLSQAEIQEAAKFFGGNTEFTCTETYHLYTVRDPEGHQSPSFEKTLAFSEGKRRHEMPNSAAPISIYRPDRKTAYEFWPPFKVILEYRFPQGSKMPILHLVKEKSEIGSETIKGHPCVKCRVVTHEDGRTIVWTTWEATDMNRFPIRAEYPEVKQQTVRWEFSNVVLTKPDPSLFEPPKSYKKFENKVDAVNYMFRKGQEQAK